MPSAISAKLSKVCQKVKATKRSKFNYACTATTKRIILKQSPHYIPSF